MSKTIFKQVLGEVAGEVKIELPENSAILSVINQNDTVVVYYLCDPEETKKFTFKFCMFHTGDILPESVSNMSYLKTISLVNGSYILHVFVDLCALEEQNHSSEISTSDV